MSPYSTNDLEISFIATTLFTGFLFYRTRKNHQLFLIISIIWISLQSLLSYKGFYTANYDLPPRFLLLVVPPFLFIILLFLSKKGRAYIDSLSLKELHWVHLVRIPVEFCLLFMFYNELIPELMTFEGRNFDIIAGITAPLIILLYFYRKTISKKVLIAWNVVCIMLLLNVVIHAILSTPYPFQQLAFDQPNIGVIHFPYALLPAYIVPLVFFSHFASIRQLLKKS